MEPIREPAWIPTPEYPARRWKRPPPIKYPIRRWEKPSKTRDIPGSVALGISIIVLAAVIIWALYVAGPAIWEKIQEIMPGTPTESMPPNYYNAARDYVAANYVSVSGKNIGDLANFLNQVKFREYVEDVFDCSEASSMLEWLLEGAGFSASIATNTTGAYTFGAHTWVLVTLDSGDVVAIEATSLTQNYYAPPGIIEAPDGRFREYTYEYRMFLQWKEDYPPSIYDYDPNITFEKWKIQYLMQPFPSIGIPTRATYYNPPKIYASPVDAIVPRYNYYIPKSELDWWNITPYNSMAPFNEWD